jgi:ubiquinone/menaquinone biosynthesis C-methylase UbiE
MMLTNLIMSLANRSPKARGRIFRWTFETLAAMSRNLESWTFMNYGYADLDAGAAPLRLATEDEPERYCIQLYHHAIAPVDLCDKNVLEVSCGRGGGASYVKRYLNAKSVTGIDFSENQIEFCRRVHKVPGLRFLQGIAEDIPLPDDCFDAVVNIEASCLYEDTARFFTEVFRILRPGGHFVYADIHRAGDVDELFAELDQSGLVVEACQDITENVTKALKLDHQRRAAGLKQNAPFFLRRLLGTFAGTQGTRIPNGLADGNLVYLSFLISKPRSCPDSAAGSRQTEIQPVPALV